MHYPMRFILSLAAASSIGAACDGPRDSGATGPSTTSTTDTSESSDTAPSGQDTPEIDGFDFVPNDGDFWEFAADETWRGMTTTLRIRVALSQGESRTVEGISARWFMARWERLGDDVSVPWTTEIAFGEHRIFQRYDSTEDWHVVFDAWYGAWPMHGGFFDYLGDGPCSASSKAWHGFDAYEVFHASGNECVTLPGYGTECGSSDPLQAASVQEYFAPQVGPVGLDFVGCNSGGCSEYHYVLASWRIAGRTGGDPVDPEDPGPGECAPNSIVSCLHPDAIECPATNGASGVCVCPGSACESLVACPGDIYLCPAGYAVDCVKAMCVAVQTGAESSNAACDDGIDNDHNGHTDCSDFQCMMNPSVSVCSGESSDARCSNGVDDDGDGHTDCSDIACSGSPAVTVCATERYDGCGNGVDDDHNGYTDCDDWVCSSSPFRTACDQ